MKYEVNECCDCATESYPCIGDSCSLRHVTYYKRDRCGWINTDDRKPERDRAFFEQTRGGKGGEVTVKMTFKEKFMETLEMTGITLDEFIEETGYNRKTVLNWLGQNHKPRVLSEICKMLDLEEDYFDECFGR